MKMKNTHNLKKTRLSKMGALLWVLLVILFFYTVSLILPLLWGIFTSLKTQNEFRVNILGIPEGAPWNWAWGNFVYVMQNFYVHITSAELGSVDIGIEEMLLNTILYAVGGAFINTLVPCVVAYITAKFNYKFSGVIYMVVIVTMVLPVVGNTASEMQLVKELGIYDTIWGNWIQKANFMGMYYLVFYATFKGIPKDFSEAAYVDGAGETHVMIRIIFPLVMNIFGTVMLIKFISFWNDYQTPLLFLPSYPTLAYGIYTLSRSSDNDLNTVPMRMAACVLMVIPIVIIFAIFKEKLMSNISMGGVKE